MFDKLLGKKNKGLEVFNLPDKKYCHDMKKIAKMEKKQVIDQMQIMLKYISNLCSKLEDGRKECEKWIQKYEETYEKLTVLNSKMASISNEHEQLQVKFINLQSSLEMMTKQKQSTFKGELEFVQSHELSRQQITDLPAILRIYRDQIFLVQKIAHQNKQLKQKYSQLEGQYISLSDKIAQKQKSQVDEVIESKNSGKSIQQTEADDEKNQLKLIIQTKQQMITILNKKVNEENEKLSEMEEKINDLNHEIERKMTQIKQKDEQIKRIQNDVGEYRKKLSLIKEQNEGHERTQQKQQDEIREKGQQLNKLKNQIIDLKQLLKLSEEEKKILKGNLNQQTQRTEEQQQSLMLVCEKFKHEIQCKNREVENLNEKIIELVEKISSLEKNVVQLRVKEKEGERMKDQLTQEKSKSEELAKKLENTQQNYEIRLKKLQFNANQERIKAESLKRSLNNLEAKEEENRKQLDEMYEKKMIHDAKYAKMQSKLKQYKQHIQYLQKQKIELEKTFQSKIKHLNMEEIVIHEADQEQNHRTENSNRSETHSVKDQQLIYQLNNRIVDLEEQVQFLKEQNRSLTNQRQQLEESNLEMQKNFKIMNNKREQVMKQISRMNAIDGGNLQQLNTQTSQAEKLGMGPKTRQKRIAEKALKGFDILSKLLNTLYKDFISFHVGDIARKEIKDMEGNINALVGKCQDMKDIFQGYL